MNLSLIPSVLDQTARGDRVFDIYALPSSKIMIHQGSAGTRGAPRDMEIQLREVLAITKRMAQIISHHTGQPLEKVERDIDRDFFMTAEEAVEYGIVDEIIKPRRGVSAELPDMALAGA